MACLGCTSAKAPRTAAEARDAAASTTDSETDAQAAAPAGDLTAEQQAEFLEAINEACADTYCEGSFGFEFDGLSCEFASEACLVSFVMFTDEPTRAGMVPTRIGTAPDAEEAFSAEIESVVPPAECKHDEVGMAAGGPPCTIVEANCVLSPIRSVTEFEDLHWDMLSHCVFGLEDAILPDAPAADESASAD